MAKRIEVNPDWPWAEKFGFHLGIRVENTVYVSGTVAWDRDGNIVGQDNMLEQSRQAFLNVKDIVGALFFSRIIFLPIRSISSRESIYFKRGLAIVSS